MHSSQVDEAIAQLIAEGDAIVLGSHDRPLGPADFVLASSLWQSLLARLTDVLSTFHTAQPARPGMAREEARSRMGGIPSRLFDDIIASAAAAKALVDDGPTLRLPSFRVSLVPAKRERADAFLAAIRKQPHSPPGPHEFDLDAETLAVLEHLGEVEKIADGDLLRSRCLA